MCVYAATDRPLSTAGKMLRGLVTALALLRTAAIIHVGRPGSSSHRQLEVITCRAQGPTIIDPTVSPAISVVPAASGGSGGETAPGSEVYNVVGNVTLRPTDESQVYGDGGYYFSNNGSGYYVFSFDVTAVDPGQNFFAALVFNNGSTANNSVVAPAPGERTTFSRIIYVNAGVVNSGASEGLGIVFSAAGPSGSAIVGNITINPCIDTFASTEPTTPTNFNSLLAAVADAIEGGAYIFRNQQLRIGLDEEGPYSLDRSMFLEDSSSVEIEAKEGTELLLPDDVFFQVDANSSLSISNLTIGEIGQQGNSSLRAMMTGTTSIHRSVQSARSMPFFVINGGALGATKSKFRSSPRAAAPLQAEQFARRDGVNLLLASQVLARPFSSLSFTYTYWLRQRRQAAATSHRDLQLQTCQSVSCEVALLFAVSSSVIFTGLNEFQPGVGDCAFISGGSTVEAANVICLPGGVPDPTFGRGVLVAYPTLPVGAGCTNGSVVNPTPAPTMAPTMAPAFQLLKLRIRASEYVVGCSKDEDDFKLVIKITNDNTFRVAGVLLRVHIPSRYLRLEGSDPTTFERENTDDDGSIDVVFRNVSIEAGRTGKFKLRIGVKCPGHHHQHHHHGSNDYDVMDAQESEDDHHHHHHHHSHERKLYHHQHNRKRPVVLAAEVDYIAGSMGPVTVTEETTVYVRE